MTSPLATDKISVGSGRAYYLETNRDQQPLQLQVPRTTTDYIGQGNQTVDLPKTDVTRIINEISAGPLVLSCTQTQNYLGRLIRIETEEILLNTITINFAPGVFIRTGVYDVVKPSTFVIPVGTLPSVFVLDFTSYQRCSISQSMGSSNSHVTDVVSAQISINAANQLNTALGNEVLWNPTQIVNQSSFNLIAGPPGTIEFFEATREGLVEINYNILLIGPLTSAMSASIQIVNSFVLTTRSTLGLSGQVVSGSKVVPIQPGQRISIWMLNTDGAAGGFVPPSGVNGNITIKYI
jgi:hypothetical protein